MCALNVPGTLALVGHHIFLTQSFQVFNKFHNFETSFPCKLDLIKKKVLEHFFIAPGQAAKINSATNSYYGEAKS